MNLNGWAVGAGIWFGIGVPWFFICRAHADPKPGLWQEGSTQSNGVTVQKIRDTTGGDHNVCYVASQVYKSAGESYSDMGAVSISCVPERP